MPLILAIEPDRRQATQLSAVVKKRLHAELVLAESAERALATLGDRVPDLILTSALLSPNDEVLLGERLRKLDAAAAHVQTLTIPVLATTPRPRSRIRAAGVLSALGLGKSQEDTAPEGCDPAVFAAQCEEYLERVAAERAIHAPIADDHEHGIEPARTVRAFEPVAATPPSRDFAVAESVEAVSEFETALAAAPEPVVPAEPEPVVMAAPPRPIVAEEHPSLVSGFSRTSPSRGADPVPARPSKRPSAEIAPEVFAQIEAFAQSIAAMDATPSHELARASDVLESTRHQSPTSEPEPEPQGRDEFVELDLSEFLQESQAGKSKKAKVDDECEVYEIDAMDAGEFEDTPAIAPIAVKPSAVKPAAAKPAAAKPGAKAAAAKPRTRINDGETWTPPRLGASQLWPPIDGMTVAEPPATAPAKANKERPAAPVASPRAASKQKPVQDEWGFFDPEQCGFAALLAKLDEIIDDEQPAK